MTDSPTGRRGELAEAATDYVLQNGLIGLSLRPLAAALGTSDRMLLYHFADKDDLVATVLRTSTERSNAGIRAMPASPDPARAVRDLWDTLSSPAQTGCARIYVEAGALGVLGGEPYASVVGEANETWVAALTDHFVGSGLERPYAVRAAAFVDAVFMGLQLDQPLQDPAQRDQVVADLARAIGALGGTPTIEP